MRQFGENDRMDDLQACANEAFDAIKKSTGKEFPHSTIKESFESFQEITGHFGLIWLLDATAEIGMSHLGWTYWMQEARGQLVAAD